MAVAVLEQEPAPYQRSPVDVLRLVVAAVAFLLCLALAAGAENTMVGVEADLLQLVDRVPSAPAEFLVGLVQLVALAAPPVLLAVALVLRRFRLAVLLVAVPGGGRRPGDRARVAARPPPAAPAGAGPGRGVLGGPGPRFPAQLGSAGPPPPSSWPAPG